jgi:hypothetical protein
MPDVNYINEECNKAYTAGYKKGFADGFDARAAYINKSRVVDVPGILKKAEDMTLNILVNILKQQKTFDTIETSLKPIWEYIQAACTIPELAFEAESKAKNISLNISKEAATNANTSLDAQS